MSSRKKDNKFKVIADVSINGEDLSISNMEVISKDPKINNFNCHKYLRNTRLFYKIIICLKS